jgi:hypothetical protein
MAEWSAAYVNRLPDASFLFIEAGGEKDEEGKTKPRSLRHLPWKDADGSVDDAHARNALARIPQTDGLSADKKQALQDKVRRALGMDTKKADTMATSTVRDTLTKIESLLGMTVGAVKSVEMTPVDFVAFAHGEVVKALAEKGDVSTRRLKALQHAVTVFKDNYVDGESGSVKVPITFVDTTALEEKQNQIIEPLKNVNSAQYDGESAFTGGFVAKMNSLKNLVNSLKAEAPDGKVPADGEETEGLEDEAKAKKAAEDEEKAKAKKVGEDTEEGNDATGHTAEAGMGKDKKTEKRLAKSDVSTDGTVWPSDLNTPEAGKVEKSDSWGND